MGFISEEISLFDCNWKSFNIIASGTGTGKTYFVVNNIHKQLTGIKNSQILYVASRSLIVDQQSKHDNIDKYSAYDQKVLNYWNGKTETYRRMEDSGIKIMTYDKIIDIITQKNEIGFETLKNVKVIVFDECHTLFSDKFIQNLEALKVWIRDTLTTGHKLIIGMTATPRIIEFYQDSWGVNVNQVNKEVIMNYQAKRLHCTNFETIPYIVTTQLKGRTIIMCYSYNDCLDLASQIPNSFVLISKSNKEFTPEMKIVRDYIVDNESLPPYYIDADGSKKELDVLITTSTLREGVNLREESGVKNIVSCFTDELHVAQFAGRARYNLDAIVVADTYIPSDQVAMKRAGEKGDYLANCRLDFKHFLANEESLSWFEGVQYLVEHDVYEVVKFILTKDQSKFIKYINKKWLVPKGEKNIEKYRIYKDEDKKEIVKKSMEYKLFQLYPSQVTFNRVVTLMQKCLGYEIETKHTTIEKKDTSYKLVIDFNEDKIDINWR